MELLAKRIWFFREQKVRFSQPFMKQTLKYSLNRRFCNISYRKLNKFVTFFSNVQGWWFPCAIPVMTCSHGLFLLY